MRCKIVGRMLALHAGGDLPGPLGARVESHVAACAACARALAALREDRRRLGLAAVEAAPVPDCLGENYWYAIRRELRSGGLCGPGHDPRPAAARRRDDRRALAARSIAAAASIVLAALLFLPRPRSAAPPAPEAPGVARVTAPTNLAMETAEPVALRHIDTTGAGAPGPYLERVAAPASSRSAIEESQPFAPPGMQYHLEGWHASETDKETLSF